MNKEETLELFFHLIESVPNENLIKLLECFIKDTNDHINEKNPLLISCEENCIEVTKRLIKRNFDINSKDSNGYSCLMKALLYGHEDIAKVLIESGADLVQM